MIKAIVLVEHKLKIHYDATIHHLTINSEDINVGNICDELEYFTEKFGEDNFPTPENLQIWLNICERNRLYKPTFEIGRNNGKLYTLQYITIGA